MDLRSDRKNWVRKARGGVEWRRSGLSGSEETNSHLSTVVTGVGQPCRFTVSWGKLEAHATEMCIRQSCLFLEFKVTQEERLRKQTWERNPELAHFKSSQAK